jgi:hypothetical protein
LSTRKFWKEKLEIVLFVFQSALLLLLVIILRFLIAPSDVDLAASWQKGEKPFSHGGIRDHHPLEAGHSLISGDIDGNQSSTRA